jgi:hypothetical protein
MSRREQVSPPRRDPQRGGKRQAVATDHHQDSEASGGNGWSGWLAGRLVPVLLPRLRR